MLTYELRKSLPPNSKILTYELGNSFLPTWIFVSWELGILTCELARCLPTKKEGPVARPLVGDCERLLLLVALVVRLLAVLAQILAVLAHLGLVLLDVLLDLAGFLLGLARLLHLALLHLLLGVAEVGVALLLVPGDVLLVLRDLLLVLGDVLLATLFCEGDVGDGRNEEGGERDRAEVPHWSFSFVRFTRSMTTGAHTKGSEKGVNRW